MLPSFIEANFDKIAAIGSYYIAAAAFILTLAALLVTATAIYVSIKQSRELKTVEVEQKKFENALDLFRIIGGIKDLKQDGQASVFLQIAAVESLSLYPEYIEVYKFMEQFWSNYLGSHRDDLTYNNDQAILAAIIRLVRRVESK